jgi:hypothetical protein
MFQDRWSNERCVPEPAPADHTDFPTIAHIFRLPARASAEPSMPRTRDNATEPGRIDASIALGPATITMKFPAGAKAGPRTAAN